MILDELYVNIFGHTCLRNWTFLPCICFNRLYDEDSYPGFPMFFLQCLPCHCVDGVVFYFSLKHDTTF